VILRWEGLGSVCDGVWGFGLLLFTPVFFKWFNVWLEKREHVFVNHLTLSFVVIQREKNEGSREL
jgi:hypothetical protein